MKNTLLKLWKYLKDFFCRLTPKILFRDIATMDANGFIRITGRTKDMIIRGGENIYPAEIENYLHSHPAIEDAQVVATFLYTFQ